MADTIAITAGSGTSVSTEEVTTLNGGAVSAQHLQRTATAIVTADGTAIDLPGDASNGLDVDVTRVTGTVTVSATNLDIRDLSSASDSVTVAQATAGNLNATVTGTVTANLAAGTNNIGDVDVLSIAAGDNNIGNVDIVSVPAPLSTTGGGTEATAQRVTIASDSTGVLSVDDNNSSLTVDGTVGVTAGTGVGRPDNNGQTWVWKCVQSTTATTTAVWTPGSGKKCVVTYFQILASGTQDGDVQLWFGASADSTYSRGTDQVIFDGHFEPSASSAPGIALTGLWPGATADHVLKITASAAINPLTVVVWGYEI